VIMSDREPVTPDGVRHALKSVLQRAADWQLSTVTTPLVGIGAGQLEIEDAARILADVLAGDLPHATYPSEVCIVVESDEVQAIVEAFLRSRKAV
jgi:O-acetyl-ADP-ribose deacetylase (regulator of RNase III)